MKPITLPPSPPGSDPAAQFAWIRACLQTIERASRRQKTDRPDGADEPRPAGLQLERQMSEGVLAASDATRQRLDSSVPPIDPERQAATVAAARTALGETVFAAAQDEGRSLTLEALVEHQA